MCVPEVGKLVNPSATQFEWTLKDNSNLTVNLLTAVKPVANFRNGNTLMISKNALTASKDYTMSCRISGLANCGSFSAVFNTRKPTATVISPTVSPTTGNAYSTNFTLTSVKKASTNLTKCAFGYVDPANKAYVQLNSDMDSKNFSFSTETFVTRLPFTAAKITVYFNCIDFFGISNIYT